MQLKSLVILASGLATIANAVAELPLKLADLLSNNSPVVNPDGPQCTAAELEKIKTIKTLLRELRKAQEKTVLRKYRANIRSKGYKVQGISGPGYRSLATEKVRYPPSLVDSEG
ncbi:hypothetical protein C0992_007604 [Termitomyces sp. T32_za158]|nr:hypothetical protein C0992_007604 [Termitomyces sp. T32_za158]